MRAASKQKWLGAHGLEHWTHFYTDYGLALQKKFFGHFLKGQKTGWDKQPKVLLQVRHPDKFVERAEEGMADQANEMDQVLPRSGRLRCRPSGRRRGPPSPTKASATASPS